MAQTPPRAQDDAPQQRVVPLKDRQLLHRLANGNYCVLGGGVRYECTEQFAIISAAKSDVALSGLALESQCALAGGIYYGILNGTLFRCRDGRAEALHEVPRGSFFVRKHDALFIVDESGTVYQASPFKRLSSIQHCGQMAPVYNSQYFAQIKGSRASFCKVKLTEHGAECSRVRLPECRDFVLGLGELCLCRGKFGVGAVLRDIASGQTWQSQVDLEQVSVLRILKATGRGFAFADSFTALFSGFRSASQGDGEEASEVVEKNEGDCLDVSL